MIPIHKLTTFWGQLQYSRILIICMWGIKLLQKYVLHSFSCAFTKTFYHLKINDWSSRKQIGAWVWKPQLVKGEWSMILCLVYEA